MTKSVEDLIATLPQGIEPEFVMESPDEPIRLAIGRFDLLRDSRLIGNLQGEVNIEWIPRLRLICTGESDAPFTEIWGESPLHLHVPQLGLTTEAVVTNTSQGQSLTIRASLMEAKNPGLQEIQQCRFYLVNFPSYLGEPVRTTSGLLSRGRLRLTADSLVCTVDEIHRTGQNARNSKPGYVLTHVAELLRSGQPFTPAELQGILDALYWLFAFMRGARTGPILPSTGLPFAKHWISIAPWTVDEARRVDSWMPDRSSIDVSLLFNSSMNRWSDPVWKRSA